jgi:hypothetical protein
MCSVARMNVMTPTMNMACALVHFKMCESQESYSTMRRLPFMRPQVDYKGQCEYAYKEACRKKG